MVRAGEGIFQLCTVRHVIFTCHCVSMSLWIPHYICHSPFSAGTHCESHINQGECRILILQTLNINFAHLASELTPVVPSTLNLAANNSGTSQQVPVEVHPSMISVAATNMAIQADADDSVTESETDQDIPPPPKLKRTAKEDIVVKAEAKHSPKPVCSKFPIISALNRHAHCLFRNFWLGEIKGSLRRRLRQRPQKRGGLSCCDLVFASET
jgi:hypothetical protein